MFDNRKVEHHHIWVGLASIMLVSVFVAQGTFSFGATIVPGHQKSKLDADANGIPDVGVTVNGHYTSIYIYDASENWYWDLGDGRVLGSVTSINELDPATLTRCDYIVNYRGNFENTPFMDSGWIQNLINCSGYDDNGQYNYLIVHESDPKYTGNPNWSVWGNWEFHTLVESGSGNLVRPYKHTN